MIYIYIYIRYLYRYITNPGGHTQLIVPKKTFELIRDVLVDVF